MAVLDYTRVDVRALSYSKLKTLSTCARKYQLENQFGMRTGNRKSVTFSFGHAVGMAVQATARGRTKDQMLLDVFLEYDYPLDECGSLSEQRGRKSVWFALEAAERWWDRYHDPKISEMEGWEVARLPDPNNDGEFIDGVELTFSIDCGDGFIYDGHIDLLLYHPVQKKFKVVEMKTSNSNQLHPAMFKNSLQAVGYSVVIDKAAEMLGVSNSFGVDYVIYQTGKQEFSTLPFMKAAVHRTIFLANLVSDINRIAAYQEDEYYPPNGDSCYNYFRECEYFEMCHLSDDMVERMAKSRQAQQNDAVFQEKGDGFAVFTFTLDELLQRQQDLIAVGS